MDAAKGRVHFIGVGGVSMSALAMFYRAAGYTVSGSDISEGAFLTALKENGIPVTVGHSAANVRDCGLVIKNAAIADDNPELIEAVRRGVPVKCRSEALGETAARHAHCIAVSGSHGKTTCGGMITSVFTAAGPNPSAHIGGAMVNTGSQYVIGGGEYFITEACEYKRGFLHIAPDTAVVLNVAMDHPDCFKDVADVSGAFFEFLSGLKGGGTAVINGDDKNIAGFEKSLLCRAVRFGLKRRNDYRAMRIGQTFGKYGFDIFEGGLKLCRVAL
jgi:UDP-N-acetylmuramate--alanine ligase